MQCRMTIMENEHERAEEKGGSGVGGEKDRERLDKSKTSSSTCASGKATSMMLGMPLGSPPSSLA